MSSSKKITTKKSTDIARDNAAGKHASKTGADDCKIGPYDIICGRSANAYNNIGNRRFRLTIRMFLRRYQALSSRADRKIFIFYLTNLFRNEIGFRFLKKEKDCQDYQDIGEIESRKKIGHALLDQTNKHQRTEKYHQTISPSSKASASSSAQTTTLTKIVATKPFLKKAHSIASALKKQNKPVKRKKPSPTTNKVSSGTATKKNTSASSASKESKSVKRKKPAATINPKVSPSTTNGTKKKKALALPTKQPKKVTKLESEICLLLIGLQNYDKPKQTSFSQNSDKAKE